jgi:hypothetical protein
VSSPGWEAEILYLDDNHPSSHIIGTQKMHRFRSACCILIEAHQYHAPCGVGIAFRQNRTLNRPGVSGLGRLSFTVAADSYNG